MDEEEIDSWYDEEKEKAMAEYLSDINKKKDRKEAEEKYKGKLKSVREKYPIIYEKSVKRRKQIEFLCKKMEKIKNSLLNIIPWVKKK